jgi:hypothetical protein
MILLYRILGTLSIALVFCQSAFVVNAQALSALDSLRWENTIRINSIQWEGLNQLAANRSLDSLQALAEDQDDERLLWYSKAYRFLLTKPVSGKPAEKIRRYQALIAYLADKCPVAEVTAHFRCIYADYALENKHFDSGFKALFLAKGEFEKIGYENLPCSGEYLYTIGHGYYVYEDYGDCIKTLELGRKSRFTRKITPVLLRNTLGMAYLRMESYELAEQNFAETIKLATAIGDVAYIGIGTGNFGNTLRLGKKPAQSLPYLYKSIEINKQREPGSAAITCIYTAKSLLALDSVAKAKQLMDMSIPLSKVNESYNVITYRRHYFEAAALYYRKIGNNRSAASYLDSTITLKDSLRLNFNKKIVAITEWAVAAEQQQAIIAETENSRKAIIERRNALLFVALIVILGILYVLYQQQQKLMLEKKIQEDQKRHAESALADATEQLKSYLNSIQEKNRLIDNFNEELNQLKILAENTEENSERSEEIEEHRKALLESVILTEKDWIHFQRLFDFVYPEFLADLKSKYPGLTSNETRLMVLLKLEVSNKQMAFILGVSIAAIRKSRQRLRKKLDAIDPENGLKDLVDDEISN